VWRRGAVRLKAGFPLGAVSEFRWAPATAGRNRGTAAIVGVGSFIPNDEQKTVSAGLKLGKRENFRNLLGEPLVCLGERTVVSVVILVWREVGIVWRGVVGYVFVELRQLSGV